MKKWIFLLTFSFAFLFHPNNVFAQQCCPPGYTPGSGKCLNAAALNSFCSSLSSTVCLMNSSCISLINTSCKSNIDSANASPESFCTVLLGTVGMIPLSGQCTSIVRNGISGIYVNPLANCAETNKIINSPLCTDNKSVNTAFGCLAAGSPTKMVSQLLGWGAIVGAGIAFLMIVFAGIQIILAGGDPKKIQAARELITSAIAGLFLIIFSVLLLNFIGVKILGLNTLGF